MAAQIVAKRIFLIGGAGYSPNASTFIISSPDSTCFARVHALSPRDLDRRAKHEWRRGQVISWTDLQDYVRRRITLAMKRRGQILGVLHMCEPRLSSSSPRPEVVALETNPRIRSYVRGVGTGLMAAAVMVSKEWGYGGALELTAVQRAVPFYNKLGMLRKKGKPNRLYFDHERANRFLRMYLKRVSAHRRKVTRSSNRDKNTEPIINHRDKDLSRPSQLCPTMGQGLYGSLSRSTSSVESLTSTAEAASSTRSIFVGPTVRAVTPLLQPD